MTSDTEFVSSVELVYGVRGYKVIIEQLPNAFVNAFVETEWDLTHNDSLVVRPYTPSLDLLRWRGDGESVCNGKPSDFEDDIVQRSSRVLADPGVSPS